MKVFQNKNDRVFVNFLKVNSGFRPRKKWNNELKIMEEIKGAQEPWLLQKFSISLGNKAGFINVEYWGKEKLEEKLELQKCEFELKQNSYTYTDNMGAPKKRNDHMLVLLNFEVKIKEVAKEHFFDPSKDFNRDNVNDQNAEERSKTIGAYESLKNVGKDMSYQSTISETSKEEEVDWFENE